MDLNDLFHREGVERLRADQAPTEQSRSIHLQRAQSFRDRLNDHRRRLGATSH